MKKVCLFVIFHHLFNYCLSQSCNNWLYLPSEPSYVQIGQLNIPGNQLTVEAQINLTAPFTGGTTIGSDIVTKYKDPTDVNYLLRVQNAQITTTTSFYQTPEMCDLQIGKTYHVAMVYDGNTLNYYRDGYLLSSILANGNLIQNAWPAQIGFYFSEIYNTNFIGYINEVRIWNVARTQAQIQAYMDTPLPNPTTQVGLLAYYQFNNLINQQGNTAWNGTLAGSAAINQVNPSCSNFTIDSCCPSLTGTLIGDTVCNSGSQPLLTFSTTATTGPFTLTYTDGTNTYTATNVQSNVSFAPANPPTSTTTYSLLSIEDTTNCSPTSINGDIGTIVIRPAPQANITGETICYGDSASLTFNATAGLPPFSIAYSGNGNAYALIGLSNNSSFDVPYLPVDTSIFTLTAIKDSYGCVTNLDTSATVNVNPLPQGGITGNNACANDSARVTFTSSSGTGPFEVQISDGTNTTVYYDVQSGIPFNITPVSGTVQISLISIIDQNGNGCTRNSGFTSPVATVVASPSPQLQFDSLAAICVDQPPFLITQATETSGISGNGFFTGAGVDSSGNFFPDSAGAGTHQITYTFIASDGCAAADSNSILVNPNPNIKAGQDVITCFGFPITLSASGAATYLWTPATGLDNPTKPNPIATLDTSTTYIVTGTDSNGCASSDTVSVRVSKNNTSLFVVPNAFTPNGDGLDDCFGISRWGSGITVLEFSIFNRWGQRLFSTTNPSDCWDGTFQGRPQPTGGYVYIIRAKTPCGNLSRTGMLMLIR